MKSIVTGGAKLFTGVEQGSGKYSRDTLILVMPIRMREAQIWINAEYGKYFKICNEIKYETSIPQMQKNEKEKSYKLDKELMVEIKAMPVVRKGQIFSTVIEN